MEIITSMLGAFVFFGIIYTGFRFVTVLNEKVDLNNKKVVVVLIAAVIPLMFLHGWVFLAGLGVVGLEPISVSLISALGSIVMGAMLCVAIWDAMADCWWRVLTTSIPLVLFIAYFILRLMAQ